ncbi:hypothetical protein CKO11_13420 [Rhodobacter sp. TJ_12]|nr:hypothetical protein [Rhodobacter sp. TJ_12]
MEISLRVIELEGEPWFVAKDVCYVLGIVNVTHALSNFSQTKVRDFRIPGTAGRPSKLISGPYRVRPEFLHLFREGHDHKRRCRGICPTADGVKLLTRLYPENKLTMLRGYAPSSSMPTTD